jgi:hypothetical protein
LFVLSKKVGYLCHVGSSHVKAWALVLVALGYFTAVLSVGLGAASFFGREVGDFALVSVRLAAVSGFGLAALQIVIGSYVHWQVERRAPSQP